MLLEKPLYLILSIGLILAGFLIGNGIFSLLAPQGSVLEIKDSVALEPILSSVTSQAPPIPVSNDTKINVTKQVIPPAFVLKGIIFGKDGSVALVNNHLVKNGDTILGAKVTDITENTVELIFEDQRIVLRLNQ